MSIEFLDCFSTPFFQVQKSLQLYGSEPYYRIVNEDGVILAVLDHEDRFVLVRQFRPNLDRFTLEFPAGGIEVSESALDAANRELWEEAGTAATFISLGTARLQMNRVVHREHLFFGIENVTPSNLTDKWGRESALKVQRIKREEFFQKVTENDFFEQLAALGLLQKASLLLELDLVSANFADIRTRLDALLQSV